MMYTSSSVADGKEEQTETHSDPLDQRHLTMSSFASATGICIAIWHPYWTLKNELYIKCVVHWTNYFMTCGETCNNREKSIFVKHLRIQRFSSRNRATVWLVNISSCCQVHCCLNWPTWTRPIVQTNPATACKPWK